MALFTYSQEPGISHGYSVRAQHLPGIFLLFSWTHMEIYKLWDSSSELVLVQQPQRGAPDEAHAHLLGVYLTPLSSLLGAVAMKHECFGHLGVKHSSQVSVLRTG